MPKIKGDFFSEIEEANDPRWENWAKRYHEILEHNEKGDTPEDHIFHAIGVINSYLKHRHERLGEPLFDIKQLQKKYYESIEHKLTTLTHYRKLGTLIHGLVLFGCSKERALLLLSEWPKPTAISTLKTAHNKTRYGYNAQFWTNKEKFITHAFDTILDTSSEYIAQKPFPSSFKKEEVALNHLLQACHEENERMEAFFDD